MMFGNQFLLFAPLGCYGLGLFSALQQTHHVRTTSSTSSTSSMGVGPSPAPLTCVSEHAVATHVVASEPSGDKKLGMVTRKRLIVEFDQINDENIEQVR